MSSAEEIAPVPGAPRPRDIAIVGMASVMPGAPDVESFWANIVDGVDAVTEVSRSRWLADIFFDPDYDSAKRRPGDPPMTVSKWGGFVPDVGFDALGWGIPPASLANIDPAQLLALKAAAGAIDDAGYGDGQRDFDRDRTSVIYATGSGGVVEVQAGVTLRLLLRGHHVLDQLPPELDAFLSELTEDGLPGALTSLISGRVANRLDLGGKNLTVDSACASVLVALEIACDDLAAGSSDTALCGGVDLHNGAGDYVSFTAAHALSRRGRCFAFDVDADGMTLAEGAGCVVLKRLADAERDGDRIYAVIKGVAGSSDGRHLGLTAPRQEGQEKAVRRAYARAGLSPAEVGLVEAHGTGTPVGDRIELRTTTAIFDEAGAPPGSVVLGTVKSNIGHIKCAAGIAALIKAAKAAYHGVLPPTLHITQPNEVWDPETSPFVFLDQARPWLDERRLVAVSSFGFGGTNFHAILERHGASEEPSSGRPYWPSELFAFRAETDAEVAARLDDLAGRLDEERVEPRQADRWRLRDVAASVSARGEGPVRLAIVADDLDDLAAKVGAARSGQPAAGVYRGAAPAGDGAAAGNGRSTDADGPGVAFLLPGPDAARPGMAADLLVALPGLRDTARDGREWVSAMLPPQAFGDDHERQRAALDAVAGPATGIASLTLARALAAFGVAPARVAGCDSPLLAAEGAADALRESLAATARREPDPPLPEVGRAPDDADRPGHPDGHDAGDRDAAFLDDLRRLSAGGIGVFVDVGPGHRLTGLVDQALGGTPHVTVALDRPGEHGLTALLHALAELAVAGVPVDLEALHAGRGSRPDRWDEPGRRPAWIVNGHCARTASGEPLPKGVRPAYEAPPVSIETATSSAGGGADGGTAGPPAAAGPPGSVPGLAPGDVAVVTEYLRILQDMMATGSDIIRGHVAAGNGHGDR